MGRIACRNGIARAWASVGAITMAACTTGMGPSAFMPEPGLYRYEGPSAVQDVQVIASNGAWVFVFRRSDAGVPPYCELRVSRHACEQALAGRELASLIVSSDAGLVDYTSGVVILPVEQVPGVFWQTQSPDGTLVTRRLGVLEADRLVVVTSEATDGGLVEVVREEFARARGLSAIQYLSGPSIRIWKVAPNDQPRRTGK